eukprot:TRINITY_DN3086_c0_g2_i4.p2 TRINITY_DN3086_c0_g2~~TRINITY_DN3086_c0_g2_i4.p2  ORF type:complete len:200 (+),score=-18.63 TRINITY_DN3086_c0_g2_i4:194-793(+)
MQLIKYGSLVFQRFYWQISQLGSIIQQLQKNQNLYIKIFPSKMSPLHQLVHDQQILYIARSFICYFCCQQVFQQKVICIFCQVYIYVAFYQILLFVLIQDIETYFLMLEISIQLERGRCTRPYEIQLLQDSPHYQCLFFWFIFYFRIFQPPLFGHFYNQVILVIVLFQQIIMYLIMQDVVIQGTILIGMQQTSYARKFL